MNGASQFDRSEFSRYLFSGMTAVGADLISYTLLLPLVGPSFSKAVSFVTATVVAYLLQKFWTFKQKDHCWREMGKFGALYGTSLILNVCVNKAVLVALVDLKWIPVLLPVSFQLGWLFATTASTIYNFFGQKFWVFKRASSSESSA